MKTGLLEHLLAEEQKSFKGWNFTYLEKSTSMAEFPLDWNYRTIIKPYMKNASAMLDMGTGGGEFLSTLAPYPSMTVATEGYKPNIDVAKNKLTPLGIQVVAIENDHTLPFESESFELIINRHESYCASEVARILKKGGTFITQQVGGLNDSELNLWLCSEPNAFSNWSLKKAVKELEENGLTILIAKDQMTKTRFYEVGAIVYYLKAISWQIKDFTVRNYYDRLEKMNEYILSNHYLDVTKHRFLIIATK